MAEVEADIKDASIVLKKMEMEATSTNKNSMSRAVTVCNADLARLKKDLGEAKASVPGGDAARAKLVSLT